MNRPLLLRRSVFAFKYGVISMLNFIQKLSRFMAYLGGLMLVLLIVMTCISIVGRSLNGILHTDTAQLMIPAVANWLLDIGVGPLNGDYELLEAGMAFSIFAFLPLCQFNAAHASVDVFTTMMSTKISNFMVWISEVLFAAVLIVVAWQITNGMLDKFRSGETTLLLQFPVWWAYSLAMTGAYVGAFVAVVVSFYRSREFFLKERIFANIEEA